MFPLQAEEMYGDWSCTDERVHLCTRGLPHRVFIYTGTSYAQGKILLVTKGVQFPSFGGRYLPVTPLVTAIECSQQEEWEGMEWTWAARWQRAHPHSIKHEESPCFCLELKLHSYNK